MNVEYSKQFIKASTKLSGKTLSSLRNVIKEVKQSNSIDELTNCKKLSGYNNSYRIRVGDYRALFVFRIINDTVFFEYLVSRGQAYSKGIMINLRDKD